MQKTRTSSRFVEITVQRVIETISLLALALVVCLRPLVAEMYDSAGSPFTEALGSIDDPSPLRTLIFDLLILLAACGWLLARIIGPVRRYRWTGLEWGTILIALAAAVSCYAAGSKRLAINASIDWLCYPALAIVLVQLMHKPWHRRLLLAAITASAFVQATQCFEQHFGAGRFADTWAEYENIKEEFWASRGTDLDSPKVELFERRIRAEEASGFMPHSNIAGSYLVLCGFVAVGITMTRWKRAHDGVSLAGAVATAIATVAIIYAVFLTKSLGALLAGGVGVVLWLVLALASSWIKTNRTKAVIIGWACVVAGIGTVIGYGVKHDRLPHMSLTFRWQYWTASADLIRDHAITGVGRENFGQHYLQYKPIDYPEEVDNPHNLFVQAAADWGLVGLLGVLVCLVGATGRLTQPVAHAPSPGSGQEELLTDKHSRCSPNGGGRARRARTDVTPRVVKPGDGRTGMEGTPTSALACGVVLLLALTLSRLPLLGTADVNFLYYNSVMCAIAWAIGFGVFTISGRGTADVADPSSSNIATAIFVGLFAFILHEMINFALFVPASATTCFALLAVGVAARSPVEPIPGTQHRRVRWLTLVAAVVLTIGLLLLAVRPVAGVSRSLRRAHQTARHIEPGPVTTQPADVHFLDAVAADPLDPTPSVERAKWLLALTSMPTLRDDAFDAAVESLHTAIARDPFAIRLRRQLMQVYQAKAGYTRNAEDYLAAVNAANEALNLYPTDPDSIVSLADRQLEAGRAIPSDDLLSAALQTYQRALDLDASRPDWEHFRGFTDRQTQDIRAKIQQIRRELKLTE